MALRITISIGDINGIGPEVVLKTLARTDLSNVTPLILSSKKVVEFYEDIIQTGMDFHVADYPDTVREKMVNIVNCYGEDEIAPHPGELTAESGQLSMNAVETGIEWCVSGAADALVTAPISKEAVNLAGYNIPGHTEFLAEKTGTSEFMMMLIDEGLRIGLVSIHVPLAKAASFISETAILNKLRIMDQSLRKDFGIHEPDIAVLGLNPHAGDGGVIGDEEISIVAPALQKARFNGIRASGPFPADGFFGNRKYKEFDGVLAMYHDQGLIPFKTLSFGKGVNFTAGLPIIRTSPDHGTAFDIAGKNQADPASFQQAFQVAVGLARNRNSSGQG